MISFFFVFWVLLAVCFECWLVFFFGRIFSSSLSLLVVLSDGFVIKLAFKATTACFECWHMFLLTFLVHV